MVGRGSHAARSTRSALSATPGPLSPGPPIRLPLRRRCAALHGRDRTRLGGAGPQKAPPHDRAQSVRQGATRGRARLRRAGDCSRDGVGECKAGGPRRREAERSRDRRLDGVRRHEERRRTHHRTHRPRAAQGRGRVDGDQRRGARMVCRALLRAAMGRLACHRRPPVSAATRRAMRRHRHHASHDPPAGSAGAVRASTSYLRYRPRSASASVRCMFRLLAGSVHRGSGVLLPQGGPPRADHAGHSMARSWRRDCCSVRVSWVPATL